MCLHFNATHLLCGQLIKALPLKFILFLLTSNSTTTTTSLLLIVNRYKKITNQSKPNHIPEQNVLPQLCSILASKQTLVLANMVTLLSLTPLVVEEGKCPSPGLCFFFTDQWNNANTHKKRFHCLPCQLTQFKCKHEKNCYLAHTQRTAAHNVRSFRQSQPQKSKHQRLKRLIRFIREGSREGMRSPNLKANRCRDISLLTTNAAQRENLVLRYGNTSGQASHVFYLWPSAHMLSDVGQNPVYTQTHALIQMDCIWLVVMGPSLLKWHQAALGIVHYRAAHVKTRPGKAIKQ